MLWGLRQGSSSPFPHARLGTPRGAGPGHAGQAGGLILAVLCRTVPAGPGGAGGRGEG